MTEATDSAPSGRWTFADQISTYRFWGLVCAWLLVGFATSIRKTSLLRDARAELSYADIGLALGQGASAGMALGLILAVLVVRWRTLPCLLGLTLVLGVLAPLGLQWGDTFTVWTMTAVVALSYLLTSMWWIVLPAVIAEGLGGRVAFASAFAVASAGKFAIDSLGIPLSIYVTERWGSSGMLQAMLALLLASLVLLPVRHALFSQAPVLRHRPLTPRQRNPRHVAMGTALPLIAGVSMLYVAYRALMRFEVVSALWSVGLGSLALVGLIYMAHWCYRIHGELAFMAPSPQLLTPRAAAIACVLMPLSSLLLPLHLGSVLVRARPGSLSMGWLSLWSVLLPPLAMAMVQKAVNRQLPALAGPNAGTLELAPGA